MSNSSNPIQFKLLFQEIIEHQKREIERLIRENEILKRHVAATCPPLGQAKSEVSFDFFDSFSMRSMFLILIIYVFIRS